MRRIHAICIIAIMAFSFGCAGLRGAIPTVTVDTTEEAVDINVHSRIDKSILCIPANVADVEVIGAILEGLVGRCAEEGVE